MKNSDSSTKHVWIENATYGSGYVLRHHAERMVTTGRAIWTRNERAIWLIESDPSAISSVRISGDLTARGYDQAVNSGISDLKHLAGTSVVNGGKLLKMGKNTGARRHVARYLATIA